MEGVSERAVSEAWQAGQAAWPDVTLEREAFARHVESVDPEWASAFTTDLYLAAACLARDPVALATFDREILGAARGAIGSIDSSPEFVDEAIQRLRAHLVVGDDGVPRLTHYAGRGSLRAWVGVAGARTALMMRRSQKRAREVPVDDDVWANTLATITTNNPELELLKRQYAEAFSTALRDAVGGLEARLRAVLKLSFVDALSIDEIGMIYAVSRDRGPLDPARVRRRLPAHPAAPRRAPRADRDRARPDDRARPEPARRQPLAAAAGEGRLGPMPIG